MTNRRQNNQDQPTLNQTLKTKLIRVGKYVGAIVTLLTAIFTVHLKYLELKSKFKDDRESTDFVIQQIIIDYNKRIFRLEDDIHRLERQSAICQINRHKNEDILKIKETAIDTKTDTNVDLKSVKQLRAEYQNKTQQVPQDIFK